MAVTPSGTISMSDINTTIGQGATAAISFNDYRTRFLANQQTGSVSMSAMRSKEYWIGTANVYYIDDKGTVTFFADWVSGAKPLGANYFSMNNNEASTGEARLSFPPTPPATRPNYRYNLGTKTQNPLTYYQRQGDVNVWRTTVAGYIGYADVSSSVVWQWASY